MSRRSPHARGARDFSSPQIRVRGTDDFRYHPDRRLRLPNERPPLHTRFAWFFRIMLPLAVMVGIGVAVYFGVTELINDAADTQSQAVDNQTETVVEQPTEAEPASSQEPTEAASASEATTSEQAEVIGGGEEQTSKTEAASDTAQVTEASSAQAEDQEAAAGSSESNAEVIHPARVDPSVSAVAVTPAQVEGAPLAAERVTAEPVPDGIPRELADGSNYDPSEPATVFTNLWPIGTTLRLTRLPGATLLSDDEQAEVVGAEVLVVVRGSQDSNAGLQLSPAAFDQVAFYGVERIIAVSVEVTAPP